jgi:PKD repeat protein
MLAGADGLPNPANIQSFVGVDATGGAAGHTVDLKIGPGGDLFYIDIEDRTLHRITYTAANQPPTARISANPVTGAAPLTVAFDGSGSTDPEGRPLTYSWDLNGDGTFGDAASPTTTYTSSGIYTASLRVTDDQGATDTASVTITVGNTAPAAVIDTPERYSDLAGRLDDQLLRPRHRRSGRNASPVCADMVGHTPPLLHADRLPHSPDPDLRRRGIVAPAANTTYTATDHKR